MTAIEDEQNINQLLRASRNFLRSFRTVLQLSHALEALGEEIPDIDAIRAEVMKEREEVAKERAELDALAEKKAALKRDVVELQAEVDALSTRKQRFEAEYEKFLASLK
ncbi:hypothetical protein I6F15_04455 [Bradyrhizobium sp. BRP14]|nr:hypothetical protein [Bradyrhizobium sp. BRP14]